MKYVSFFQYWHYCATHGLCLRMMLLLMSRVEAARQIEPIAPVGTAYMPVKEGCSTRCQAYSTFVFKTCF